MLTKESINAALSGDKEDKPKYGFCKQYYTKLEIIYNSFEMAINVEKWMRHKDCSSC